MDYEQLKKEKFPNDLETIIKEYRNTQVQMTKKSRILSIVFNEFKTKGLVRERKANSVNFILED